METLSFATGLDQIHFNSFMNRLLSPVANRKHVFYPVENYEIRSLFNLRKVLSSPVLDPQVLSIAVYTRENRGNMFNPCALWRQASPLYASREEALAWFQGEGDGHDGFWILNAMAVHEENEASLAVFLDPTDLTGKVRGMGYCPENLRTVKGTRRFTVSLSYRHKGMRIKSFTVSTFATSKFDAEFYAQKMLRKNLGIYWVRQGDEEGFKVLTAKVQEVFAC